MAAGTASLVLPALAAALLLALYRRQRRGKLPHPALRDTNWVREHGGEAQPAASGGLALSLVPAQAVPQSGGHASGTSSSQAVEASVRERARAHLKFGNLCARSGKLERALKHYSSAAAVDPTFAAPRYNCAGVCQRLKRFTEAVEHYEAALALKPGSIEAATNVVVAHLNAGQQLSPSGHPDQSLSHYRAAADKCHRALRVQAAAFDAGSRPDIGRFNSEAFANLNIALRLCGQQKQAVERTWRQLKELSRADEPGAAGARVSCPSAAGRSSAGASAAGLLAAGLSALGLATAAVSDAPPGSARPPLVELPPLDGCIVPAEDEIEIDCGPNRRTASACSPGPATAGGTLCRGAAGACAPSVLTVVCVKWGSKYGPEYVNRLYAMVDRHLARPITKATSLAGHQGRSVERTTSLAGEGGGEGRATDTQRSTDAHSSSAAREGGKSGPCFRFACLTDDPIGLRPEVEVLPVPVSAAGWQGWWLKACLFSDGCPINGRVLYLDLDTVSGRAAARQYKAGPAPCGRPPNPNPPL
jgi:Tfp pilus assembly protein PilF